MYERLEDVSSDEGKILNEDLCDEVGEVELQGFSDFLCKYINE